jgi:hypothetical protein
LSAAGRKQARSAVRIAGSIAENFRHPFAPLCARRERMAAGGRTPACPNYEMKLVALDDGGERFDGLLRD